MHLDSLPNSRSRSKARSAYAAQCCYVQQKKTRYNHDTKRRACILNVSRFKSHMKRHDCKNQPEKTRRLGQVLGQVLDNGKKTVHKTHRQWITPAHWRLSGMLQQERKQVETVAASSRRKPPSGRRSKHFLLHLKLQLHIAAVSRAVHMGHRDLRLHRIKKLLIVFQVLLLLLDVLPM